MTVFPAPRNITELTRNLREIIEKHSTIPTKPNFRYLGRDCIVVSSKIEALAGAKEIEAAVLATFNRISQNSKLKPSEIYAFKGVLTVYDFHLQFETLHPSEVGTTSYFPEVMKRIDRVYQSLPKAETHPALFSFEEDLKTPKRLARDNLPVHGRAQHFLSTYLIERDFIAQMQPFTITNVLYDLKEKQIDLKKMTPNVAPSVNRLLGQNSSWLSEAHISIEGLLELSECNFLLALLISNVFEYHARENVFSFLTDRITNEMAITIVHEINETLNTTTTPLQLKKLLESVRDVLRRQYITKRFDAIHETQSGGIKSYKSYSKIINNTTTPLDPRAKLEFVGQRIIDSLLMHNQYLLATPSEQQEDAPYHIMVQTLIAEHTLSKPFLNGLFRLAHEKVLSRIEGIKVDQFQRYLGFQKALHNGIPFSTISLPSVEDAPEAGMPLLEELEPLEDADEVNTGESSATAASKKRKKKKKKESAENQASSSKTIAAEIKPEAITHDLLTAALEKVKVKVEEKPPIVSSAGIPKDPAAPSVESTLTDALLTVRSLQPPANIKPVKRTYSFRYHPRVQEWFTHPETALARPEYATITSADARRNIVACHAFSTIVDEFMISFGIETSRQSPKTGQMEKNYCIPTEIRWDNGKTDRGLITYALTQDGRIFHRCFTNRTPSNMIGQLVKKGFFELVDFPPLEREAAIVQETVPLAANHEHSYIIEPSKPYKVQIRDDKNGAVLTILKVR